MASPITRRVLGIFWKPKWQKHAKMVEKSAHRFINYKRDLLAPDRIDEMKSRIRDLKNASLTGTEDDSKEAIKQLEASCQKSMPSYRPANPVAENIEVFFVAIVVALGLRAYVLQPFRIPTGSMQPTLNGIRATELPKEQHPNIITKAFEKISKGRSYIYAKVNEDKEPLYPYANQCLIEKNKFWFFTYTYLLFKDGTSLAIHAPKSQVLGKLRNEKIFIKEFQSVQKGSKSDAGDMVFVDKFSYHFRKPKRSEVFVFDTLDITKIHQNSGPQGAGSHYIKRLVGVPGDKMSITPPLLLIDGQIPKETIIQDVMNSAGSFEGETGYELASSENGLSYRPALSQIGQSLELKKDIRPIFREYFALGDNTNNSLDSKYWGPVRQYNLIGPALFALWPFDTGHWGLIK